MSKYIRVEDAIEAAISGCASWDGGYFPSMDEPIKEEFEAVDDKCVDLVRCGECKHHTAYRCKNDMALWKHMCGLGHGTIGDDWFCADGERRTDEQQT